MILIKSKRLGGSLVTLIPMSFVLTMSFWAALVKLGDYFKAQNWLLFGINIVVIAVTVMVVLSALSTIAQILREQKNEAHS